MLKSSGNKIMKKWRSGSMVDFGEMMGQGSKSSPNHTTNRAQNKRRRIKSSPDHTTNRAENKEDGSSERNKQKGQGLYQ